MKLSLVSPSRNNLKYLRWSYASVRKNCSPDLEYCVAVDFSDDGTKEWCNEICKNDPNFKYIVREEQTKRWGCTIWYDILIEDAATGDVVMIWHADMYATPKMDERVLSSIKRGQVVSLTRVEPPFLHPPGEEKLQKDFGLEPEEFDEEGFLAYNKKAMVQYWSDKKTGMFAPWAIFKEDFLAIGGHDPLFAPQSREDSDLFNRFLLAGYKSIQLFDTFVYHMTCRGSRFAGLDLSKAVTEAKGGMILPVTEWITQNGRAERNFIRKWGHMVKTDVELKPIIPPKYNISFWVDNCNAQTLYAVEPWCSRLFVGKNFKVGIGDLRNVYIESEQPNTQFDLSLKIIPQYKLNEALVRDMNYKGLIHDFDIDILVSFDANLLTIENFKFLTQLPEIIAQNGSIGEFKLDIFKIQIFKIETYEKDLIKVEKKYKQKAIEEYIKNDNLF